MPVFRPQADSDSPGGQAAERRNRIQRFQEEGRFGRYAHCQSRHQHPVLSQDLSALGHPGRPVAALLNSSQYMVGCLTSPKRRRENPRGSRCVLDREINPVRYVP